MSICDRCQCTFLVLTVFRKSGHGDSDCKEFRLLILGSSPCSGQRLSHELQEQGCTPEVLGANARQEISTQCFRKLFINILEF